MPLYEYLCPICENKFELLQPLSKAAEDTPCLKCNTPSKRALSMFACYSRNAEGWSAPISGGGTGCASCSASSCASCHSNYM